MLLAFFAIVAVICVASVGMPSSQPVGLYTTSSGRVLQTLSTFKTFTIQTLDNKVFHTYGSDSDLIFDMKERIEQLKGVPVQYQLLFYRGRELFNTETLQAFDSDDSFLLQVLPQEKKYQLHLRNVHPNPLE